MKCFFDSSRAKLDGGHSRLILAGFMAGDLFWNRFDTEWRNEVLQKREPHAPYLHMKKLYSTEGEFEGFTKERWNNIISDAVNYLQQLPKRALCGIVCTIDEHARDKLIAQGCTVSDPYIICAECCIGAAFSWSFDNHPEGVEPAYIYFDQNEPFMHDFRQRWLRERKRQRPVITNAFWGLIAQVNALDMRHEPALQAADMLAWATSRKQSGVERPMRFLVDVIEKVIPNVRLTLDEKLLREKHTVDAQHPEAQSRPE
jgi:Protein of unknown function (DUF3800)